MANKKSIKKTTLSLFLFTVFMFGFGYAMVPLYDVFCNITGLNGKTIRVTENVNEEVVVSDRLVSLMLILMAIFHGLLSLIKEL